MRHQKQAFKHLPEQGVYGDCHRTAMACILGVQRDTVPNFAEWWDDVEGWEATERKWLAGKGYAKASIAFDADLKQVLAVMGNLNPGVYYILGGRSSNGTNHSVVGLGGSIDWDPALDDSGIVGPMDDGFFWITFLIPLRCTSSQTMSEEESA